MISIKNVSKIYTKGQNPAVDNLNLEVMPGEIFGFIGPNGAGKTTTIKMLTGIIPTDSGTIEICGTDIEKEDVKAKYNIGYVSDNHEIYEKITGIEYLNFLADVYGISMEHRKERIEKYLKMFDMTDAAQDIIKSYSHGMKQKICLIGALVHEPRVWVLDEPLTGLDPKSAHLLKEQMKKHCEKGNTVFFSTHVLEVAEKLCDRIGIIDNGTLIAIGTLEELRNSTQGESSLEALFLKLTEDEEVR